MSNAETSFDLAIAHWSFGWLPSDRLPDVAIQAMEMGFESPSLFALASSEKSADPDLHGLFGKVVSEMGRTRLSKSEAGRCIAREYARKICNGKISPVDGARVIWKVSLDCEELTKELGIFGGRVSEYDDLPDVRDRISELILSEATSLLSNFP